MNTTTNADDRMQITSNDEAPAVLQHDEGPSENYQDADLKARPSLTDVLDNADNWWRDCARRALEHLAATGRPFTAYDVTELGVPDPDHPNRWGGLFQAAYKAGLIVPCGYAESRRQSRAGGLCRVWKGVHHGQA